MKHFKPWDRMQFSVRDDAAPEFTITLNGRERWALETLISAGDRGITEANFPGARMAAFVHSLRRSNISIETVYEPNVGEWKGHHARYVLRSVVSQVEGASE